MKKLLMSLVVLLSGFVATYAEDVAEITFETITHDFGTFPEENGKVSCEFKFTNTGKADLVLQKVRASCGCTTPEWTKEPVKPGASGIVKATYNASGRPGAFNKTITVTTNVGEKRLSIKGEVVPKAQKVEDKYPHQYGDLRLMKKNVYFNTVLYPQSKTEKIEIINNGSKSITVSAKADKLFKVTVPATLAAGEKAQIIITANTENSGVWGSFKKSLVLTVDGKEYSDQVVNMFGNVAEDFSKMTAEEKANAPVISISNSLSLGSVKANSSKTFEISLKNEGKSALIIRSVNIDPASSTVVSFPSKGVKAGRTGVIRVKVNTTGMKSGKFSQRLTIVSNDPNRSTFVVNLNGEVAE